MTLVRLDGLSVAYDGVSALSGIDGAFAPGRITAVAGPNGSGKSTLLKAIAGLVTPSSGRVALDGAGPADVAYLPQNPGIDHDFPLETDDFVALGFLPRLGLFKGVGRAERDRLAEALARVGLQGLERRPIATLSGGQFQRAQFARVMAQDARIVLLDEPFSALDAYAAQDLCAVARAWAEEGRTVIAVLHDLDLIRALCGQTLVLAGRRVAWGETETVLASQALEKARALSGPAADARS